MENSEGLDLGTKDLIRKVVAIVREKSPTPSELNECFSEEEITAANSLLHNWEYATNDNPKRKWKIKKNEKKRRPTIKSTKTGDVETLHYGGSGMAPNMSTGECKKFILKKMREGPLIVNDVNEMFEAEFGEEKAKRNLEKIAYAMEEIRNEYDVIIGENPKNEEENQWILLEE